MRRVDNPSDYKSLAYTLAGPSSTRMRSVLPHELGAASTRPRPGNAALYPVPRTGRGPSSPKTGIEWLDEETNTIRPVSEPRPRPRSSPGSTPVFISQTFRRLHPLKARSAPPPSHKSSSAISTSTVGGGPVEVVDRRPATLPSSCRPVPYQEAPAGGAGRVASAASSFEFDLRRVIESTALPPYDLLSETGRPRVWRTNLQPMSEADGGTFAAMGGGRRFAKSGVLRRI